MKKCLRPIEIRRAARERLAGKWTGGVLTAIVLASALVACAFLLNISHGVCCVTAVLLAFPAVSVGCRWVFLNISRGDATSASELFAPFGCWLRIMVAWLLVTFTVTAGMLFLLVPGIILSLGLSMTFYIMRDDSAIPATEAMKQSWSAMRGHKREYFLLLLGFIGWMIPASITVVGVLWLIPYVGTASAEFYNRVFEKNDHEEI
ncbi:DUF975 family protein [Alistipes finegoldii]|uniref:DUF975 family protein n=1 Tax=Alistipes finegoldii TaxID=214856 RepID=UPI00242A4D9D|nr:DUF975 family protein [Alistipes finegoldii]